MGDTPRPTPADATPWIGNVRRYPIFAFVQSLYFWMPVFFLYFDSLISIRQLLWLEAGYYLTVVLLEVPSGYLSDRVGRRLTLILSGVSLLGAYVAFYLAEGVPGLLVAQILLGTGLAMQSGTDTTLHLDSLEACGRSDEYGPREARISRWVFWAGATGALCGGLAATIELRYAYGLSIASAVIGLALAWRFSEPPGRERSTPDSEVVGFYGQLGACVDHIKRPILGWLFAFGSVAVVVNHIPYELYQPYLDLLLTDQWGTAAAHNTPLVAGFHVAAVYTLAGVFGGLSIRLSRRIGIRWALLLSLAIQAGLIGLMAMVLHPIIALVLVMRGVPRALQVAPMNEAVAPRLPSSIRATYLSLQSLSGRLGYALVLLGLSLVPTGDVSNATWPALGHMLGWAASLAVVATVGLALWRPRATDGPAEASAQ